MATTPLHRTFASIESDLKLPLENYFFSLCGHFIRVIRSNVHLVHQIAREFLLADFYGRKFNDRNIPESNVWQHSISLLKSNGVMLNICLSYLSMFGFSSDTDDARTGLGHLESNGFQKACDKHCYLKYAAEYWPSHFKSSDVEYESELSRLGLQLCRPSFAGFYMWLEPHLDTWGGRRDRWKGLDEEDIRMRVLIRLKLETLALPLLQNEDVNVNSIDGTGQTLLHLAVLTGSTKIVQTLLEQKALVNATDSLGSSPLQMSLHDPCKEAITRALSASNADVNQKDHALRIALCVAAEDGGLGQIAQLLAHDEIDVNAVDKRGDEPINIIRQRPTMDPDIIGRLWSPQDGGAQDSN